MKEIEQTITIVFTGKEKKKTFTKSVMLCSWRLRIISRYFKI